MHSGIRGIDMKNNNKLRGMKLSAAERIFGSGMIIEYKILRRAK